MPSTRHILTAAALGALGGTLSALWVTIAEAQGIAPLPARAAAAPAACAQPVAVADSSAPRRREASKPVVDAGGIGCP